MKILFFHYGTEAWFGVGYLSSILRTSKHQTDLLLYPSLDLYLKIPFFKTHVENRLLQEAINFHPDLIAFTSTTYAYQVIKKMASKLKQELHVLQIIGGIHATILPEHVLKTGDFDMVCLGEGEETLLELVNRMEQGKDVSHIQNLWIKQKNGIIKNPLRPLNQDIDSLPFPDYDLFEPYGVLTGDYAITTSRGCSYSCTYCCNYFYKKLYQKKGKYVRRRSVDNVIDELTINWKKYGFRRVYFWDDVFCQDGKWLEEFNTKYKKAVGLPFHCLSRPEDITERTIRLIKDAGCSHVNIGIESGNERIRKQVLNRKMSNEQIIRAAGLIKKNGIKLNVFNMFGIPGETSEDMWDTLTLNEKVNPDGTLSFLLSPFPGTKIAETAVRDGLMSSEQVEEMKEGISSGLQAKENHSNINHPYQNLAVKMKTYLPIINQCPNWLKPFFRKKILSDRENEINQFIYFLYLVCADRSRIRYKLTEFWKPLLYYIKTLIIKKKKSDGF